MPRKYNSRTPALPFEWGPPPPPRPKPKPRRPPKRPPRRKDFGSAAAESAAVVRGALIARLEQSFYRGGALGEVLRYTSGHPEAQELAVGIFDALLAALFPEEFLPEREFREAVEARWAEERERKRARVGLGLVHALTNAEGRRVVYPEVAGLVPDAGPQRVGVERLAEFAAMLTRGTPAQQRG